MSKERIQKIISARRNLHNAGVALLEVDDLYAFDIKNLLEKMIFTKEIAPCTGANYKKQIEANDVMFYLQNQRIYVDTNNIILDFDNNICYIKLNETHTSKIPLKNAIGFKGITPK